MNQTCLSVLYNDHNNNNNNNNNQVIKQTQFSRHDAGVQGTYEPALPQWSEPSTDIAFLARFREFHEARGTQISNIELESANFPHNWTKSNNTSCSKVYSTLGIGSDSADRSLTLTNSYNLNFELHSFLFRSDREGIVISLMKECRNVTNITDNLTHTHTHINAHD